MGFDGIAVSAIVSELDHKLKNARMIKIYQIDKHSIIFKLRTLGQTKKLVISANPAYPRIHTTRYEYINPISPPAFCMLLRKYLEPSRLLEIRQYELERLIEITFETYDHNSGYNKKQLKFEILGRHSNIILIDQNNVILDAVHRVANEKHDRQILPGIKYQYPPDQGKMNPKRQDRQSFINEIRLLPANIRLDKGLMSLYQGLGPQTAQEIIKRARLTPTTNKQDLEEQDYLALWNGFTNFLQAKAQPVLVNGKKPGFYAYRLTGAVDQKDFSSLDLLMDEFYTSSLTKEKIRQIVGYLIKICKTHLNRLIRKQHLQKETLLQAANCDHWQKLGELLLANIHLCKKGDTHVKVTDYYQLQQPEITIDLDPALTPSENSQLFFSKYAKAKKSEKVTRQQLRKTTAERKYIEEIMFHIEQADSLQDLEEIKTELVQAGYIKSKSKKQSKKLGDNRRHNVIKHYEYQSSNGIPILIGKNNRQNDILTFKTANPDDIWLHAQKIPGSHVIIRTNKNVPDTTLLEAATLAAYHSQAKASPKVPVDYTKRKYVKKPKGSKPGFVVYTDFKTITVDPSCSENLPNKSTKTKK